MMPDGNKSVQMKSTGYCDYMFGRQFAWRKSLLIPSSHKNGVKKVHGEATVSSKHTQD